MFKLEIYQHIYVQFAVFCYKCFHIQAEFCIYVEIEALRGEISDFSFKI